MLRPPGDSSAIMQSVDSPSMFVGTPPDLAGTQLTSLKFHGIGEEPSILEPGGSFLLIDGSENLQVTSASKFVQMLGIGDDGVKIKVVSIFGNTGDGKSHTLNETFFGSREVFSTGGEQGPRTLGVWAAWDPVSRALCLDTEGLQGVSNFGIEATHEEQRTRLLLKVLAVSDVVLYRTRSERLRRDLYTFLGSASKAYVSHFSAALMRTVNERQTDIPQKSSALGPALIIFHETRYTKVLESTVSESAEDIIRDRFSEMKLDIEAFSSLRYVGIQAGSQSGPGNHWSKLRDAVRAALEDTAIRASRSPKVVLETLKLLNDKFSGTIEPSVATSGFFPDQYFTCGVLCEACNTRCICSMGHTKEKTPHTADLDTPCTYQHQFENCVYLCKSCYASGKETIVTPRTYGNNETSSWLSGLARYAWSGYVIDCSNCGEIYRSRQYWFGNQGPEESAAVIRHPIHIWPGDDGNNSLLNNSQVSAQRILDGVAYLSEAVASVGAPPTRVLSSWVADQIAPKYWRPNNEIKECFACKKMFGIADTKHHCRACGEGFCETCSRYSKAVPERGWDSPVRVCDICFRASSKTKGFIVSLDEASNAEVRARRYSEAVMSTISTVASAVLEYPRDLIKETARPSYWQPDSEATNCCQCNVLFDIITRLHHCRACGKAVCAPCSSKTQPVPERGWTEPVRVCDGCLKS